MKLLKYFIFLLPIFFSSCLLITRDNLEDDILHKFDNASSTSTNPSGYTNATYSYSCTLKVTDYCVLQNSAAFKIGLTGNSTGYKYYFNSKKDSESIIYKELSTASYNEGSDNNIVFESYSNNKCPSYLHMVGFENRSTYGPSYTYDIPTEEIGIFDGTTSVLDLQLSQTTGNITWRIKSDYNYEYFYLTDKNADSANKLNDAALWLTYAGNAKSVSSSKGSSQNYSAPKADKILIVVRANNKSSNKTYKSSTITRRYLQF